ncbi:LuxR C-terminal-related transcriptional regulator [Phytoactinopolyspora mesophila]|uniref:LuxR C-terminal-related transcriptional regulator n=1 Tax=Phytoactinopolyspora mesophila TaxID=2650750 RepID=UPI0013907B0C
MSQNAVLSAALAAALTVIGWRAVRVVTELHLMVAGVRAPVDTLILVADPEGRLPDVRSVLGPRADARVVAVATKAALASLADAVERAGVVAVADADQPMTELAHTLDQTLRLPDFAPDRARLTAALRAREDEARRFTALTPRELDVLGALLAGRSAAEIATADVVTLATVRSHIRALMSKLRVSSQLAAVALTHRSCREAPIVERIRQVHQF